MFVAGKRAKPVIMFGVDSLSTQDRIRYRIPRPSNGRYVLSKASGTADRATHRWTARRTSGRVKINRECGRITHYELIND